MRTFLDYLKEQEEMDSIVIAFGRFAGLHEGHKKLIDAVVAEAKRRKADHMIFPSPTFDKKKNPVPFDVKVDVLEEVFPYANINDDESMKHIFRILPKLAEEYDEVILVGGSDRVKDWQKSLGKYIKHPDDPDFREGKDVPLKSFKVMSAGDRDPDAEGVKGMSGTKMRELVKDDDFTAFWAGMPKRTKEETARKLFDAMRDNLA